MFNRLTSEETEFEQYTGTPSVIYENSENWKITFNTVSGDNWSDQGFYLAFYDKESWDDNLGDYSDLSYFGLGEYGTNSVSDSLNSIVLLPNVNNMASTLTILRNRNYIIFTVDYGDGTSKSKYVSATSTHNRVRFEGSDITDYMSSMSEPTIAQSLSEATGLSTDIMGNIEDVNDIIKHKLDVAGITYDNDDTLTDTTYLLNSIDSTQTQVSKPSYNNSVSGLANNFNSYKTFLTSILSNQGFSTTGTGLTSLVQNIKFTPEISLVKDVTTINVGDTVTLTATLTLNGSPMSGANVKFYNADTSTLLDTVVTDSNGEAEYSFTYSSMVNVVAMFDEQTSDYINVSSRNLNVNDYLFYDNATDDTMLSTYNNASRVSIESGGSVSFTYDSTNQRYKATTSGNGVTGITLLTSTSNTMTGRLKFRLDGTSGNRQVGIYARYGSTNYFFKLLVAGSTRRVETSVSNSDSSIYSSFSINTDYIIEFIRNTTSLTGKIYNAETDTLIKTLTLTGSTLTSGRSVSYGLMFGYNSSTNIYFDEVTFKTS